jgi:hypothetical protein
MCIAVCMPKQCQGGNWEEVLHQIEQAYMLEYAIADKAGVVHKVLQKWEL